MSKSTKAKGSMGKSEKLNKAKRGKDVSLRSSLVTKIVIMVVSVILLTVSLMFIVIIPKTRNNIKEITQNNMIDVVSAYGAQLESSANNKGVSSALQNAFLTQLIGKVSITSSPSSYAYVVDSNGNMRYHPDKTKVGNPVENSAISEVVANMTPGNQSYTGIVQYEYNGATKYASYYVNQDADFVLVLSADESEIFSSISNIMIYGTVGALISILISSIIATLVAAFIVRPIYGVTAYINRMAQLNLSDDGTLNQYTKKKDEIASMGRAMLLLNTKLSTVIDNVQKLSDELYQASETLDNSTKETAASIEQVEKAVNDISEGATSQAGDTQTATANVITMGKIVEETSTELENLKGNAGNMLQVSSDAMKTLESLDRINSKAKKAIDVIAQQTTTTNESALKIREVTSFITSIADETNLLSLNASIEAARAGEQGKSFAVVAAQIQKLAEQSNESAMKIEKIIDNLITESDKAVTTMSEVKKIMDDQSEHVEMTGKIFGDVHSGIDVSIEGIGKIAEKSENLGIARHNVVDVVQNLTAIAEENAASTEETSASVTEVSNIIQSISGNVTELKNVADELDKNMKQFQL